VGASGLELSESEGSNKITYENGSVYIGMVIKDKIRHGFGNYQWADGSKYEGIPKSPKLIKAIGKTTRHVALANRSTLIRIFTRANGPTTRPMATEFI
jgi:hypothetical protein